MAEALTSNQKPNLSTNLKIKTTMKKEGVKTHAGHHQLYGSVNHAASTAKSRTSQHVKCGIIM